jgi:hypothetical protein
MTQRIHYRRTQLLSLTGGFGLFLLSKRLMPIDCNCRERCQRVDNQRAYFPTYNNRAY